MTTAQKLKVKDGNAILVINAPSDYKTSLGILPSNTRIVNSGRDASQIHLFVKDKERLEKELKKVLDFLKGQTICWVFFPKGTSKIQTDLNRDSVWTTLQDKSLQMINLISFDDTWSAFGMRQKTEADKKKKQAPKERSIFDYADPLTKTVKLPDDFAAELKKNKKQEAFFNTLSFTNKKEYVEWIVTAKREHSRDERVKTSIERLGKEWKNPSNR